MEDIRRSWSVCAFANLRVNEDSGAGEVRGGRRDENKTRFRRLVMAAVIEFVYEKIIFFFKLLYSLVFY